MIELSSSTVMEMAHFREVVVLSFLFHLFLVRDA